jgi:hypothetical protein
MPSAPAELPEECNPLFRFSAAAAAAAEAAAAAATAVAAAPQEGEEVVARPLLSQYSQGDSNIFHSFLQKLQTLGLQEECVSFQPLLPGFGCVKDSYKSVHAKDIPSPVCSPLPCYAKISAPLYIAVLLEKICI